MLLRCLTLVHTNLLHRRSSLSESESDPMNSTIHPQGNPKMDVPPERAESNPNILGFIDESLYTGPGTRLQLQWEEIEVRTDRILTFSINYRKILMSGNHLLEILLVRPLRSIRSLIF